MADGVSWLYHVTEGVEINPKKTEAVRDYPRTLAPMYIRSFLGIYGYYWRFMDGFESIASFLTTLTQEDVKFEWSEACERSFQILKYRLTTACMLTLLEGTKGFVIYCDASRVRLGCLLMQHGKFIAYASRQLKV